VAESPGRALSAPSVLTAVHTERMYRISRIVRAISIAGVPPTAAKSESGPPAPSPAAGRCGKQINAPFAVANHHHITCNIIISSPRENRRREEKEAGEGRRGRGEGSSWVSLGGWVTRSGEGGRVASVGLGSRPLSEVPCWAESRL
jgi:hypothetical protein